MLVPDYPSSVLAAATAAIRDQFRADLDKPGAPEPDALARAALEAAAPLLERSIRRKMVREILDLAKADANLSHINKGPWGDVDSSVRRLARGEPLPDAKDLRGGGHGH